MIKVAVLGYGTVGSGVLEVFQKNQEILNQNVGEEIELKYVLDRKKFPGDPVERYLIHDFETIVTDPEIKIVVEVMGGLNPSFDFVKRCLENQKSVCTSNKELVAQHGTDLLLTAKEHHVNFLFEASCGGGIPIIRPLYQSLTADRIDEVSGILNGTTNYILSKMTSDGYGFEEVLKRAQDKGYAERDPQADVEGYDACRKIAILSSLAFGNYIDYKDIYTEGITDITATDIKYAKAAGAVIKLLAIGRRTDQGAYALVCPVMIDASNSLYSVNSVFNAVSVHGNMIGDAMFYGKGAGKRPTASAVVADVVEAAKNPGTTVMGDGWNAKKLELMPLDDIPGRFFVRIQGNIAACLPSVESVFGEVDPITVPSIDREFGFFTGEMTEAQYKEKTERLEGIIHMIRVRF